VWKDGRVGTYRGLRQDKGNYGGTAFGEKGSEQSGGYSGHRPLLVEIVKLFRTGVGPVGPQETLEIYAFMEAADESKRRGDVPVDLAEVSEKGQRSQDAKRFTGALPK